MANTRETTATIDHLLEVLNERTLGYRTAAENVKDADVKSVFEEHAVQAERFADELLAFSDKFSATEMGTRPQGDAWRTWMDLKSAITNGGRNAMIGASMRGEDAAISNYEDALENENLNPEVRGILSKQLTDIKAAKMRIERLKS